MADQVALQACTISARCPGQSAFLSSPSFPIICIMIWCDLSTNPFICGWYGMVCNFFMPRNLHISSTMLHPITQEPGWGSEDWDVTLIQELGNCLTGVTYTIPCFVKWCWNTRMLVTLGSLFSSRVISMLVKSTCKRSIGVVATVGCRGALDKSPSCCKQCTLDLMDHCIWLANPGCQKCYFNKDKVWSWP